MGNCFDVLMWQERLLSLYSTKDGYELLDSMALARFKDLDGIASFNDSPITLDDVKLRFAMGVLPLITGTPFYLADEVMPLVRKGADSLPSSWRLLPSMLFKNSGFVWFENPVTMESGVIPLVGMGWIPQWESGVTPLTGHEDVPFEEGDMLHVVFFGIPAGRVPAPVTVLPLDTKQSFGEWCIRMRTMWISRYSLDPTTEKLRLFAAFLSFCNQRILERYHQVLPRQMKRQRARKGLIDVSSIQVIRLRQVAGHHNGVGREVDWSCRWMVSGHWRNQFRPSYKDHYPKWIMPYLKGPEDKPLKLSSKTTLFNANR